MAKKAAKKRTTTKSVGTSKSKGTSAKKKSAKKKSTAKGGSSKQNSKRELINTGRDKRYVRRDDGGRFEESDDVGRSLSADRRKKAKRKVKAGQGDRGDQKRS